MSLSEKLHEDQNAAAPHKDKINFSMDASVSTSFQQCHVGVSDRTYKTCSYTAASEQRQKQINLDCQGLLVEIKYTFMIKFLCIWDQNSLENQLY